MLITRNESKKEQEHYAAAAFVRATPGRVFDYVDDHMRLSSHMSRSSWMMGGGRMEIEVDEGLGKQVGSHIRLAGRVFGILLSVEEVVTERQRPCSKVWKTIGAPRLLVIDGYEMGFDISSEPEGSRLRVFINYATPQSILLLGWLKRLLAKFYAKWCVTRMIQDAVAHCDSL
jgi:hypothetical protein